MTKMTKKELGIQLALGSLSLDDRLELTHYETKTTSKKILTVLSTDEDIDVRENVAGNPNTPPEALEVLSRDKEGEIQSNVANNPNTPIEVLRKLSTNVYSTVRYFVAYNPNTPIDVLKKLSVDIHGTEIALGATKNLNNLI